ncbi:cucurbitadienol 11-hydroxylase [Quercus suber]|uniref:cucurbitadienol 11-hydroxylase n=1 Tax=Quercus suber TaxID=58331 RepID=UPI000CE19CA6|nr:cytochrome P450 87A3-like [Quercus suber]
MSTFGLCLAALFVTCVTHWIYKWRNPKCNGILPPGSMGLPLIGETLQMIIPSYSFDVSPFIKKRLQRYRPLFRSNIASRPVVVSADPEFHHFILQQEGKLVESWYLDLFAKVFKQGENRPDGSLIHKYVRNLALSHFGAESLKAKLLPQLEELVNKTICSWSSQESIKVRHAASEMAFHFGAKLTFSYDPENPSIDLTDNYYVSFSEGLLSFPLNIPCTAYHKCLENHKKALNLMLDVLNKKLASPGTHQGDVLDHIIEDMKFENFLTEEFVVQLMFGLLYVSFDSISLTLSLACKLLSENPVVLEELTAEHEEILKRRENPDSPITWEEYKSMTFTLYVINETLRLASVTPGLIRRALKDIQVNGYTIPAGWAIVIVTSALQLNPNTFEDPLAFNPWRWKDLKANDISKHFMPFGGGTKHCAGSEYSRVLMSLFFHVLVTKYRWTKIEGGDIVRTPNLKFRNTLRIKISKKHT